MAKYEQWGGAMHALEESIAARLEHDESKGVSGVSMEVGGGAGEALLSERREGEWSA